MVMKKYIFIMALASLTLSACVNETLEPTPSQKKGKEIFFEGSFSKSSTATKVEFQDAVDGIHALTWSEGDQIGIFTYNGSTTNNNMKATLHKETAGNATGVFVPEDRVVIIPPEEDGGEPTEDIIEIEYPAEGADEEDFLIYYPYRDGMEINADDFSLHASVAHDQVQDKIGDRKVISNGLATAIAKVLPGSNKATFALTHKLAYVCVKAYSSEFVGYQLHAVHMFDMDGQAALSGDFIIDPETGTFTVDSQSTKPSVRVDVANHDFSSNPEKNELYLAVLPGDYSTADIYFEVTFINAYGATKNIPLKFDKTCKFPAGSLSTIDLGEITSSMVNLPWYSIDEERDLVKRCAYGSQNTYFAQRPASGSSTAVTIDVKARGDFSRVREPKYYALLSPSEYGCVTAGSGRKFLSLDGTTENASMSSNYGTGKYETIGSDYEFTVYVVSPTTERQGMWGTVAIYDENKNILWSYMIQGYLEDDVPQDMDYGDFKLLDRFLGQGIGSKKAVEYKDLATDSPAYFQWGRKDPFVWSNSKAPMYTAKAEKFKDVADAASEPCARVMLNSEKWYEGETRFDLWGGSNNTEKGWYDPQAKGHKTVYDPCPAGYRVPDAKVFNTIKQTAQPWEVANGLAHQIAENIKTDTPFTGGTTHGYRKAHSALAVQLSGDTYDYFPYCGFLWSKTDKAYNERSANNVDRIMLTWSNSATASEMQKKGPFAVMLEYGYWSSSAQMGTDNDQSMNMAFPIRCQKID